MIKKFSLIIFGCLVALPFLGSSNSTINFNPSCNGLESFIQNQYSVTGRTKNQYGQNYTVSLRVTGSSNYYGNIVSYVEYNDGNNWVRTQHYSVFNQAGVYTISVNYKTYYFEF